MAARRRRRKPPIEDAVEHAVHALDKTAELEVQYINSYKGTVCVYIIHLGSKMPRAKCM